MKKRKHHIWGAIAAASLCALAVQLKPQPVTAADHNDGPQAGGDNAADIADVYAWHLDGRLTVIVSYEGDVVLGADPPVADPAYDPDVLYTVFIENSGDLEPEHTIYVRYGQNLLDEQGMRVDGLPGEAGPAESPVDTVTTTEAGNLIWSGRAEDPFFFDLQGFQDTIASATEDPAAINILFMADRDAFAGRNVTGIALELDAATACGKTGLCRIWATSGRRPAR